MAMEASHIRFALHFKDALGVADVHAFVSGSVYPDSRYVSGIDRLATHPEDYRADPMFMLGDFRKGWYMHLLADDIQGKLMREMLPQTSTGDGTESWIKRTAIKVLQDMDDVRKFDIVSLMPAFEHVENPNGEDIEIIQKYSRIFPIMYARPDSVGIEEECEIWRQFGIGDELVMKIQAQAEEYTKDTTVMSAVGKLYDAMLIETRDFFVRGSNGAD